MTCISDLVVIYFVEVATAYLIASSHRLDTMDQTRALDGARILLVDDELDQVEMYRFALEEVGFVVFAASTGGEAVTRARHLHPDAIVLDVRLPDITGWEVCGLLKSDPGTEQIPVLILTAAAAPTLAADAAKAGCAGYLLKPCYPDQLIASLREVLAAA
jgi:two-component system, cell cycle response regulator DivK